mmetsp:Transcript_74964/g.150719  ORF Transcript_74964/g.150719 Transcript_74964/m.150719 type:complete len:355 (+) Transcript_74964:423-1487(+)
MMNSLTSILPSCVSSNTSSKISPASSSTSTALVSCCLLKAHTTNSAKLTSPSPSRSKCATRDFASTSLKSSPKAPTILRTSSKSRVPSAFKSYWSKRSTNSWITRPCSRYSRAISSSALSSPPSLAIFLVRYPPKDADSRAPKLNSFPSSPFDHSFFGPVNFLTSLVKSWMSILLLWRTSAMSNAMSTSDWSVNAPSEAKPAPNSDKSQNPSCNVSNFCSNNSVRTFCFVSSLMPKLSFSPPSPCSDGLRPTGAKSSRLTLPSSRPSFFACLAFRALIFLEAFFLRRFSLTKCFMLVSIMIPFTDFSVFIMRSTSFTVFLSLKIPWQPTSVTNLVRGANTCPTVYSRCGSGEHK